MINLTMNDYTQTELQRYLSVTERLLAEATTKVSGTAKSAEIILMPDLGFPYNIERIHGGFITGALYCWETSIPFVPVDGTVNVCSTSLFRLKDELDSGRFFKLLKIGHAKTMRNSSYVWNFDSGNHFIIYGEISDNKIIPKGKYVILHSSAAEFKNQGNGLYPVKGNWYFDKIERIECTNSCRYLRYISGRFAERFIQLAHSLVNFQKIRHYYFAETIFKNEIEEEVLNTVHYGMPTCDSLAIGCHWSQKPKIMPLLTAPNHPVFLVKTRAGYGNQVSVNGKSEILFPHGLGVKWVGAVKIEHLPDGLKINDKKYRLKDDSFEQDKLKIRSFNLEESGNGKVPKIISNFLNSCPAKIEAIFQPEFTYSRLNNCE